MLHRLLKSVLLAGLFLAGVAQAWSFAPRERAIFADDQLYFYVAERVASGVPPHVSMVDHKNQLGELISGAAIAIGRHFGVDDVSSARIASVVLAAAVVPLLAVLGEALTGSVLAGVLGATCALTFRAFFMEAATGFRPQLFMTFFAVAALVAYAKGRVRTAGALAAGAYLCWQPAAVIGIALLVAVAFEPRPRQALVGLVLGAALGVMCYEAYFVFEGALSEQLYQSFVLATFGKSLESPPFTATVRFIVHGDPGEHHVSSVTVFAALMLTGLVGLLLWAVVRPRDAYTAWRRSSTWRAVLVAASGAIAFTFLDHQAYPDRFFVLPYVALTAAVAPAIVLAHIAFAPMALAAAAALGTWMLGYAARIAPPRVTGTVLEDQRAMARDLGKLVDVVGGGVWAIGRPDLLALERRQNWNAFSMLFDDRVKTYLVHTTGSPAYRPIRNGRMPSVIVVARVFTQAMPWLRREYRQVPLAGFASAHTRVFVKKSKLRDKESAKQCGDPTGERFPIIGLAVARPPAAKDALHLLLAVVGARPCQPCVCDVDGSGTVTAGDALRLLKIAAGEKIELKCPPCMPGPNQRLFQSHIPSRGRATMPARPRS